MLAMNKFGMLIAITLQPYCVHPAYSWQANSLAIRQSAAETIDAVQPSTKPPVISPISNIMVGKDGTIVVQNSSSDARSVYQMTIPAKYVFVDNIRSTVRIDTGSNNTVQHTAAYGAYVYNKCLWGKAPYECNGVGLFSQGISGVNSSRTWPINTACNDNGYASSCGNEHDVTVQNESSVYTLWSGIIQGTVQPGNANGIHLSRVAGALAQWTYGFVTDDGGARNFGSVGALASGGTGISSQPLWLNGFDDKGRRHAVKIQSLNHALNISDNTLLDGLSLIAGNGRVAIQPIGNSKNTGLEIAAKGEGKVSVKSDIEFDRMLTLKPTRYRELPPCDGSHAGVIAFIDDATGPVTAWHQEIKYGGGTNTAFVSCNGYGWHAFDH